MLLCCWLGGRKGIRPAKTEWWGAGVVICLERGADLHMAQLMPLPLIVSCFSKIQIGFTFLVLAYLGSPRKRAIEQVCVLMRVLFHSYAFVDPMDRAVGIVFFVLSICLCVRVYVHGQRHSQTDLPSTSSLLFVGTAAQKLWVGCCENQGMDQRQLMKCWKRCGIFCSTAKQLFGFNHMSLLFVCGGQS